MLYLPEEFKQNMRALLGGEYEEFIRSYSCPAQKGLRVNSLRCPPERFMEISPFALKKSVLCDCGFIIDDDSAPGKHPYHLAGVYYLQEPSAMSVISMLDGIELKGMNVLDMCAAPGGKTGAIAAKMCGEGLLVANETVNSRALELAKNVERLGITNAVVTNAYPERLAQAFPSYFGLVVVDAPCSGEGMFRKNPLAAREWSPEHSHACAVRQLAILRSAERCVSYGGYILYSTCTFSVEENEGVISRFTESGDFEVISQRRLYPHSSEGEGHFMCLMRRVKASGGFGVTEGNKQKKAARQRTCGVYKPCKSGVFEDFMDMCYCERPHMEAFSSEMGKTVFATPEMVKAAGEVPCIACGVQAGLIKERYFEPSHTLFMAANFGRLRQSLDLALDSHELSAFLRGEELTGLVRDDDVGYFLITTDSFPLGFCKATCGSLKNKLPKGLRRGG